MALGKDLSQMIEVAADATGEFERLKSFCQSQNNGDTIFTFAVTETVKITLLEIESYLIKLGPSKLDGAMKKCMDSADGAISNFQAIHSTRFF